MFDSMIAIFLTIAAIGAGLMAGVYFAFSGFIMRSLDQLGAAQATDAMNAINEVILRSWFMLLFFGSTVLYAVLSAIALFDANLAGRWLLFTAGLIYVFGMFLCTAMFNVPLNNFLAEASDDDSTKSNPGRSTTNNGRDGITFAASAHWRFWPSACTTSRITREILGIAKVRSHLPPAFKKCHH